MDHNDFERNVSLFKEFSDIVVDAYGRGEASADFLVGAMRRYSGTNIGPPSQGNVIPRSVEIVTSYLYRGTLPMKPIGRSAKNKAARQEYKDFMRFAWLELTKEFNWPWGFI